MSDPLRKTIKGEHAQSRDEILSLTSEQWEIIKGVLKAAHNYDEEPTEASSRALSRALFQWDDIGRPGFQ